MVCYKEIEEDVDVSDGERELLEEVREKGVVKATFGKWTVKLDLSQEWEMDASA